MVTRDIKRFSMGPVIAAVVAVGTPSRGEEPAPTPEPRTPVQAGVAGRGPDLTPAYVQWGVGALSAGMGALVYAHSRSTQRKADEGFSRSCPIGAERRDPHCARALDAYDIAASGRTLALVLSAGGLVGLIGGTMAFVIESKRAAVPTAGKEDSATLRAWVNPTSVGLSGTF